MRVLQPRADAVALLTAGRKPPTNELRAVRVRCLRTGAGLILCGGLCRRVLVGGFQGHQSSCGLGILRLMELQHRGCLGCVRRSAAQVMWDESPLTTALGLKGAPREALSVCFTPGTLHSQHCALCAVGAVDPNNLECPISRTLPTTSYLWLRSYQNFSVLTSLPCVIYYRARAHSISKNARAEHSRVEHASRLTAGKARSS